jgi:hypothetical protein
METAGGDSLPLSIFCPGLVSTEAQVRSWISHRNPKHQNLYVNSAISTRGRSGISALMYWADEMFVGP